MAIALAPVGRLAGRLTADDLRAARRRKLRVATWQALDDDSEGGGLADAITDDDGRFVVSAIAAGSLTFEVDEGDEPVYLSPQTTGSQVEPPLVREVIESSRLIALEGPKSV